MVRQDKVAFTLWGFILVLACAKALIAPEYRSVFIHYFNAGTLWSESEPLYNGGRGFIYLPTFAFLSSALNFMGLRFAEAFWQLLQIGVFVSGLYLFTKKIKPVNSPAFFLWITLFSIASGFSSMRNGQANILIMGLALWTAIALTEKAWNKAAAFLVLGIAIKPTFIVFFLLVTAMYRPLWIRLLVGVITTFVLPMLFKSPSYVISQYLGAFNMVEQTIHVGVNEANWANLLNVLPQLTGQYIPHYIQTIIRVIMAIAALVLCLKIRKKTTETAAIFFTLIVAMSYLLIFNPRTENNDYVFIGCFYGYLFACAFARKFRFIASGMVILILLTIFSANIGRLVSHAHSWITPLSASGFVIWFVIYVFRGKTALTHFVTDKKITLSTKNY